MKEYIEKKTRKYVIATLDNPTLYLRKIPGKAEYCFVEDIDLSTKAVSKSVMNEVLKYFYLDTRIDIDLVIIPIEITYAIIDDEQN